MSNLQINGNTRGLKASALRAAERVYRRGVAPREVYSRELAQSLCAFSHETGRQIGVLMDRRGRPAHVVVGDAHRLLLPDVGRLRSGKGRLRGLRLVHTHLIGEGLTNDDLTDLALLRLDMVVAITMTAEGTPAKAHCAHMLPSSDSAEPWRILDAVSAYELTLDPLALIEALEEEFARAVALHDAQGTERALVVHVNTRKNPRTHQACVAELRELCRTADVAVLDTIVQRRPEADPKYVVGKGKLEQIVLRANQLGADLLIFDPDLSPAQARAISDATELRVIDRSMLILDIFARHARTREGKLQVELAQLQYMLPRLVAKNTMMSRLTGGIGGRGPGETKLEINRRRARTRIAQLNRQLEAIARQRARRRSLRQSRGVPVVSIVGYTNAGKTTLLNTLTKSNAESANKLFATLSPISRRLRLPHEREIVINDTVGFIHDLPQDLVNAFRATLEELREADALVHVVDVSDTEYETHITAVKRIIADLGLAELPMAIAFNKIDKITEAVLATRGQRYTAVPVCARDPDSIEPLVDAIETLLWGTHVSLSPISAASISALP